MSTIGVENVILGASPTLQKGAASRISPENHLLDIDQTFDPVRSRNSSLSSEVEIVVTSKTKPEEFGALLPEKLKPSLASNYYDNESPDL